MIIHNQFPIQIIIYLTKEKEKIMKIKLSDHFTYKKLFRFTLPTIIMMLFTSIYSVVDGIFVSNFVGKNALSSINIIYPLAMVVAALALCLELAVAQ